MNIHAPLQTPWSCQGFLTQTTPWIFWEILLNKNPGVQKASMPPTSDTTLLRVVEPTVELLTPLAEIELFPRRIEEAGRTCYRSEERMGAETADAFCRMLIRRGHESVLEHCQITVRLCCDRATSHQLVRHRLCAYSQESQRFVAYRQHLEVIQPPFANEAARQLWFSTVQSVAQAYHDLLESHERPENARALLPNCTATRLVMSANVRQWRHIFRERALNRRAQDQIRQLMHTLLEKLARHVPCLFEDLLPEEAPSG